MGECISGDARPNVNVGDETAYEPDLRNLKNAITDETQTQNPNSYLNIFLKTRTRRESFENQAYQLRL